MAEPQAYMTCFIIILKSLPQNSSIYRPLPSSHINQSYPSNYLSLITSHLLCCDSPLSLAFHTQQLQNMGVLEIIIRVSFVGMLIKLAMAANHNVGGPNGGWDTNSDLQSWASSQKFSVGDNLIFQYPPSHDVVEVTKADYDSCQPSSPIQSYNDGATTIPLTSPGKRYFICGTMGHCSQGMKVEIDTLASAISSASSPAASPSVADSPAVISIIPSTAPEESPTTSPAESPEYIPDPEAPSPLFESNMESPTFSPVIPSTEFPASASPLTQHSQELSASSTNKGNLQASIAIVLSFLVVFIAF